MAWTAEVKERRVAAAEAEYGRAVKSRDAFSAQRADLEAKLEALTPEELERREKRVAKAKRDLDWNVAAPVEGEDD